MGTNETSHVNFCKKNITLSIGMLISGVFLLSACGSTPSCLDKTVLFDEQSVGTKYQVSDIFIDTATTFTVLPFYNLNNDWDFNGRIIVSEDMPIDSFNPNISLFLNSANIGLETCSKDFMGFRYCKKNGNVNLIINSIIGDEDSFLDFRGQDFDGVSVNVISSGEDCGIVELSGKFERFQFQDQYWIEIGIGGEALFIDSLTTWSYQD